MKYFSYVNHYLSVFLQDTLIKKLTIIYFIFFVLFGLLLIWKKNQLPPQIPLFYSLPRSPEQLGTPLSLIIIPFLTFLFFCIDFILSAFLFQKEKFASILLYTSGIIVAFLAFITTAKIIFLVT